MSVAVRTRRWSNRGWSHIRKFVRAARTWGVPARPIHAVPLRLRIGLVAAFCLQLAWHALEPPAAARREVMPPPPTTGALRVAAVGEPSTMAALGLLWLQFHDEQAGLDISWGELDYHTVRAWLERLLALEPASDYPPLLAVRVYGAVADPVRQRIMLDFARDAFMERPLERWRWLAEAALLARHRLGDADLALDYARLLAERTNPGEIPHWARDLQIFILEDMGELEAARVLIGGLLASGEIENPNELRFLERKLRALKKGRERASAQ